MILQSIFNFAHFIQQMKLEEVREAAAQGQIEKHVLLEELRALAHCPGSSSPRREHSVDWIVPGAKCQARTNRDAPWQDAIILTQTIVRPPEEGTVAAVKEKQQQQGQGQQGQGHHSKPRARFGVYFVETGVEATVRLKGIRPCREEGWGNNSPEISRRNGERKRNKSRLPWKS